VDEEICPTFFGGDEPVTLFGVEPLDGALSHGNDLKTNGLEKVERRSPPGKATMAFVRSAERNGPDSFQDPRKKCHENP
jgi:hypothetical protein